VALTRRNLLKTAMASCDAICDAREWRLHGTLVDGKGEPTQDNAVSHGCAPARFRQVNVLDAGGKASA
jgi:TldD protein